tara:strand:+ start:1056 stop:2102 length:1047 start_codon:yes stop_codon:yes gene_type:complete
MTTINLGIIGGGQLGSMLASAAKKLGIKTVVYCDDKNAPAQNFCDEFIFGDYQEEEKLNEFINKINLVTFEFENIPYETLKKINEVKKVFPSPEVNKIIQNRLTEKDFINKLNIKTTEYKLIRNKTNLEKISDFLPGIIKTCTLGYDGKGQFKINTKKELDNLNIDFNKEYIFEKLVSLKKEISVIITRFGSQKYEIYEPIENEHNEQILKYSKIPAEIDNNIFEKSKEWAKKIAEELDYIGTLCVEYFIDKNNTLYVNEIAPRVHNSGHLTINSHNISQFENHIRAVCALEKKETKKLFNANMVNLIGEDILKYRDKKFRENEFFFDYQKKEVKPKRKMGHFTTLIK